MNSRMIMIVGDTRSVEFVALLQRLGWGRMVIGQRIQPYSGEPWGFDNGAYRDWKAVRPFDGEAFLRRLDMAQTLGTPYLAVVPDIVAGGKRSLEFSLEWLDRLPDTWPWYLAVQDGMTPELVAPHLHRFHGIFLGGTNRFKSTALLWRRLATEHVKAFHFARAGTPRKLEFAAEVSADSVDSAFPLWVKDRMAGVVQSYLSKGIDRLFSPHEYLPEITSL